MLFETVNPDTLNMHCVPVKVHEPIRLLANYDEVTAEDNWMSYLCSVQFSSACTGRKFGFHPLEHPKWRP